MRIEDCRFCKGKPSLSTNNQQTNFIYTCDRCRVAVSRGRVEQAIISWNLLMRKEKIATGRIYTEETRRTRIIEQEFNQALTNYALGLCGEAGEVADSIKKHLYHGHAADTNKLIEELGDALWYITAIGDLIGITLDDIMKSNLEKLRIRYPDGFDPERSMNREAERKNDNSN